MPKIHIGLIALTAAAFAAMVCLILHFQSKPKPVNMIKLAVFESMPAQDLMSETEYQYYTRALDSLECDLASIVLNTAFIRQYPQFGSVRLRRQCDIDEGCYSWKISAGIMFDELGYCHVISQLNQANTELSKLDLKPTKFNPKFMAGDVKYENVWVRLREQNIAMLIRLAQHDYVPALLKIGELLQRGDVFIESKEVEYYVLRRACFLGYEACADLSPRLATLKDALPSERAILVEQKASTDTLPEDIYLADLLMTGKL